MWNYRLCKETIKTPSGETEEVYSVREVYYNPDGSIWGITEDAVSLVGESREEIANVVMDILGVLTAWTDILDLDNLELKPRV